MNSFMMKRALLAVIGLAAVWSLAAAQEPAPVEPTVSFDQLVLYHPELLSMSNSPSLLQNLALTDVIDNPYLPAVGEFGWVDIVPSDIFPVVFVTPQKSHTTNTKRVAQTDPKDAKDAPDELMTPVNSYYVGGEVGFMYGHSSGKWGRDEFGSYIVGGVGDDKFNITVGASSEQSTGRIPRWAR